MGHQVIVSGHIPVEITKPYKIGLEYAVLEARFFFFFWGGGGFEWNERAKKLAKNSNAR